MKMHLLNLLAGILLAQSLFAQADTINARNHTLKLDRLHEGRTTYLVYFTDSLFNRKTTGDIWQRDIRFGKRNNQEVVFFTWNWFHNDTVAATILNICDRGSLAPVFQKAEYRKRGLFARNFTPTQMLAADSVPDNEALKREPVDLNIPIISWELDLETYPLLPIRKVGQQFDIAFYDPNEKAPSYHRYVVDRKEKLRLNPDTEIECWILKIDYGHNSWAEFWLTEKSKEVVKMKEYFRGNYRFKVRLY